MKKIAIACATMLLSGSVFAQFYVGGAVGASDQDVDCSGADSCDSGDTGTKLYIGYKFTPMFAAELGFTDWGKVRARVGTASATYESESTWVGGAVFVPIAAGWTGVGRFGFSTAEVTVRASQGSLSASETQRHTNPYFGLGVGYALTRHLSLNGAADFSQVEFDNEKSNATLLSIGLSYTF